MPEIVSLTRDTDWAIEAHDPINEMLKQLYQMINQLGQLDKSIILLYLEDKSYEEIAEITGLIGYQCSDQTKSHQRQT